MNTYAAGDQASMVRRFTTKARRVEEAQRVDGHLFIPRQAGLGFFLVGDQASDRGDFDGATASLGAAKAALASCPPSALVAEEIGDLEEQADRMRARPYQAKDGKYQSARAMAA